MTTDPKVWLSSKKQRNGTKRYYYLRWIDPDGGGWKNKSVGTDKRRAEGERVKLEQQLREGTYRHLKRITWAAFSEEITGGIAGEAHRAKADHALRTFGESYDVAPSDVTYAMLRDLATKLRNREPKLSPASINGVFRYLRLAFHEAIERGYIKVHPMPRRWKWEPEDERVIREVTKAEQKQLEATAKELYGQRWKAFVVVALGTGARRGELLSLPWDDVDLPAATVRFTTTKTHRPRTVPIQGATVRELKRLRRNIEAAFADGPFRGMADNLGREWGRIRTAAGLKDVKLHDLRRTYITRLIRAGVALPLVSKLAGNGIGVIMDYYNAVGSDEDKRDAVARLA